MYVLLPARLIRSGQVQLGIMEEMKIQGVRIGVGPGHEHAAKSHTHRASDQETGDPADPTFELRLFQHRSTFCVIGSIDRTLDAENANAGRIQTD